jgi:hypothetical protein
MKFGRASTEQSLYIALIIDELSSNSPDYKLLEQEFLVLIRDASL